MTITAVRTAGVQYSGDNITASNTSSQSNTNSNAVNSGEFPQALSSGNNTITLPTGFTVTGVDIIPLAGNTTAITYKSVAGDTGTRLHNTVRSSIAFDSSVVSFVLNAGSAVTVRLAWW